MTTNNNCVKISIIIACYNLEQYIEETIDSIKKQTYSNWEAIIVNDGSTDETEDKIKQCISGDARFQYVAVTNGGPSKARNIGIERSCGKYILPLDGDDTIEPTYIEKGVAFLEKHKDYALFYCRVSLFGERRGEYKVRYKDYKHLLITNSIVCSAIIRTEDCKRIGGFDESFRIGIEDWEFFIRLLYHNDKVYQSSEFLFNYRIKRASRNNEHKQNRIVSDTALFKKHIDKYIEYWGNPIEVYEALKWKRKYYNIWYKRLFYSIFNPSKLKGIDL